MSTTYRPGYKKVFLQHNGTGPWECAHCGKLVMKLGRYWGNGYIHHIDEDKWNNDPSNLTIMHSECHAAHHNTGKKHSVETRRQMSESARGHEVSVETRRKIGDANRGNKYCVGRQYSPETREKLRNMGQPVTCECGMTTYPGSMASHLKAKGHKLVGDCN